MKPDQLIDVDALAHILSGHRADGGDLPVQHQHKDVKTYGNNESEDGKVRHRVAYLDLTLSPNKDFSIAWAFAETESQAQLADGLHSHDPDRRADRRAGLVHSNKETGSPLFTRYRFGIAIAPLFPIFRNGNSRLPICTAIPAGLFPC